MQIVIGYRLDRMGCCFERHAGGSERRLTPSETRQVLGTRPDLMLTLDNKG